MNMSTVRPSWSIIRTVLLGGLAVLLPITILTFFFKWIYFSTTELIEPLTTVVVRWSGLGAWLADFLVLALLLLFCFITGFLVRTRFGGLMLTWFETRMLAALPGYQLIKETVTQFVGNDRPSPFSTVALVRLFGDEVSTTAFVTAVHDHGFYTVFVPTGPNPTSGLMFHVPADRVQIIKDISVETAMRTVIGCGIGAQPILLAARQQMAANK